MLKTLRSYLWWTYSRGSFHYDVMVTFILLFIFVTPHLWNYRDRPIFHLPSQVTVENNGEGQLIYQVRAEDVNNIAKNNVPLDTALDHVIEPVAGEILIDRFEPVTIDGKIVAYKVWAHR